MIPFILLLLGAGAIAVYELSAKTPEGDDEHVKTIRDALAAHRDADEHLKVADQWDPKAQLGSPETAGAYIDAGIQRIKAAIDANQAAAHQTAKAAPTARTAQQRQDVAKSAGAVVERQGKIVAALHKLGAIGSVTQPDAVVGRRMAAWAIREHQELLQLLRDTIDFVNRAYDTIGHWVGVLPDEGSARRVEAHPERYQWWLQIAKPTFKAWDDLKEQPEWDALKDFVSDLSRVVGMARAMGMPMLEDHREVDPRNPFMHKRTV
jgi:hypothetical protein